MNPLNPLPKSADLILFRSACKDLLRPKKILTAGVLVVLPSLAALLQHVADRASYNPEVVYNVLSMTVVFGFVLVILSVVFGTGVISQEIEEKTIVYLLTRPVPRWRILLVKFAAALMVIVITVCMSSTLLAITTHGMDGIAKSRLGRDLFVLPFGALAYGAFFLLLATLINRPLMYGLFFAFGWESWVPNLPGNFRQVSLMTYLRALAPHPQPQSESAEISDLLKFLNPENITQAYAWKVLLGVSVVTLLASMIWFSIHEYVPREDAE